jgi:hypothetical protein
MNPYPLRKNITREQFNRLVIDVCHRLAAKGINPDSIYPSQKRKSLAGRENSPPLRALHY